MSLKSWWTPLCPAALATVALLAAQPALAAEVVWLTPPASPEEAARIVALAEATRPGTPLASVAGQADAWSEERDGAAHEDLDAALRDVRAFEQRLDGELLIMRDLAGPLSSITVLRDEQDRERVYAALAYQGFAVDRFFESDLASDERAEPYRDTVSGQVIPLPWRDAVALEPERAISAYEIAEAPQRVRYEKIRAHVTGALPGALALDDLPSGVTLVVDGRAVRELPGGILRVTPGRHFAHLVADGRIVSRWSGLVTPGGRVELPLQAPDPDLAMRWRDQLPAAPPQELVDDLAAIGETVWLVDPRDGRVFEWTSAGVRPLDVDLQAGASEPGAPAEPGDMVPTAGLAVGAGWFATQDFYLQDPLNTEPNYATVNAAGLVVSATAGVDLGRWRLEAGSDVWVTLGGNHVAMWGDDNQTHVRAFPHVAAGLREARLAVGWLTPHHLGLAPRLTLPAGPVELVGNGTIGISVVDGPERATWEGTPVFSAWVGVGARFGGSSD